MKYNVLIGGAAGQGIDTIGSILQKILKSNGFYSFSTKDYMSRVRGGHNFIQIRFGDEFITSHDPFLDIIIALNQDTIDIHEDRLKKNGIIISDNDFYEYTGKYLKIPMTKIAKESGNSKTTGSVAIGAVIKLLGLPNNKIEDIFNKAFSKEISSANIKSFNHGYDLTQNHFSIKGCEEKNHIIINGNQAIGLGALAGGMTFYSAYPMTPATSIMTYLSKHQRDAGILVEQAEDEIAAINMAIGASYAGVRAMTGTSGGGFSLMVEGLGLASIMETPLVVVNVQRPGPATGLPTRTAQSDLSFILSASQDEFPRMIISVKSPEDAFYQTARALNLADKFQMLIILLSDQYLSDYSQTIPELDFSRINIDRYIANEDSPEDIHKRYRFTKSGVSPRLIPGRHEGVTILADSHEHNEYGFVDESTKNRILMMHKRMNKLELLKEELNEPSYIGVDTPEILLLGWGSTYGPLKEAIELLQNEGYSVGALVFGDLYPLPQNLLYKYSSIAKTIVNVEHNYAAQLAKLIRQETGIKCERNILKYDGRQLSAYDIYKKLKEEVL